MDCPSPAVKLPKCEDNCSHPSGAEVKMNGAIPPPPYISGPVCRQRCLYIFLSQQSSGPCSDPPEFSPSPLRVPVNIHCHIVLPSTKKVFL